MTIEQLSSDRMLITLRACDLSEMGTTFEMLHTEDTHSRRVLMRLLIAACRSYGIDCRQKRFLIEALPTESGCILLVSLSHQKSRKKYRIKRPDTQPAYVFDCADDMLDGMARMSGRAELYEGIMYVHRGRYILLPGALCDADRLLLSEYARPCALSRMELSALREHGAVVAYPGICPSS